LRAAAREAFAGCTAQSDVVAVAKPETLTAPYDELVRTLRNALTKARAQRTQHTDPSVVDAASPANADHHLAAGIETVLDCTSLSTRRDETVMMNREDNKNLLLAIVLSAVVLLGWNYFYGVPQMEAAAQAQRSQIAASSSPASVTPISWRCSLGCAGARYTGRGGSGCC
jgi:hypothetical protein